MTDIIRVLPMPFRQPDPSMVATSSISTSLIATYATETSAQQDSSAEAGTTHGVMALFWGQTGLDPGEGNLTMFRVIPAFSPAYRQIPVQMPFPGSVVGMSVYSHLIKTAGSAGFKVFRNGTQLISGTEYAVLYLPDAARYAYTTWPGGLLSFQAGDRLDVRVSTSPGLTPAGTMDVEVMVSVIQTEEL